MSCTCGTCGTCCPEAADVTVNNYSYTLDNGNLLRITVTGVTPILAEVLLEVIDSAGALVPGRWFLNMWFVDSPADLNTLSIVPPATPGAGINLFSRTTDATGDFTLNVGNPALDTWYLCVELFSGVYVSAAITVGV